MNFSSATNYPQFSVYIEPNGDHVFALVPAQNTYQIQNPAIANHTVESLPVWVEQSDGSLQMGNPAFASLLPSDASPTVALASLLARAPVFSNALRQFRSALRGLNITGDRSRGIYRGYYNYRGLSEFTEILNELIKGTGLKQIPLQTASGMDDDQVISDMFDIVMPILSELGLYDAFIIAVLDEVD